MLFHPRVSAVSSASPSWLPGQHTLRGVAAKRQPPLWAGAREAITIRRTAAYVKGFRMPAGRGMSGGTEAGVRKASKEETAGGVRTDGGVNLWGICRGCLI